MQPSVPITTGTEMSRLASQRCIIACVAPACPSLGPVTGLCAGQIVAQGLEQLVGQAQAAGQRGRRVQADRRVGSYCRGARARLPWDGMLPHRASTCA